MVEFAFGEIANQLFVLILLIGVLLVVALAAFVGYRFLNSYFKYKYKVDIIDAVGESNFGYSDVAREYKEGNNMYMELLKTRDASGKRVRFAMPDPRFMIPFGLRRKIFMSKIGDMFTAMKVVRNSPANFVMTFDDYITAMRWREQTYQRAINTYGDPPSFWERHQQLILFSTAMTILLVMAFVIIWQLQSLEIVVNTGQVITG